MRFFSSLLLSFAALAVTAQDYKITGVADAAFNGQNLYLVDQTTMQFVDSCTVADGAFAFEGSTADQCLFMLRPKAGRSRAYILVEPGANITVDFAARPAAVSDNGGLNDKLNECNAIIAEAVSAVNAKGDQLMAEGKSRAEISALLNDDIEALYAKYREITTDNKDNMVGAYFFMMTAQQFYATLEDFDAAVVNMKYAGGLQAMKDYRNGLVQAEATSAGKMFVDFAGFTTDGAESKLSDYVGKGKFVLVDFWASWCGPCRGEIPNLVNLQAQFGGEKFTVLGVNVWDDEASFKEALASEGITYPQIFVPQGNKDNATELYGIKGIPQIILFAPDGTIVRRDLRGEEMINLVTEKMQ